MASTSVFKMAYIAVLVSLLVVAPHVDATITCEQVTAWLTPCISYGIIGGIVPPACCSGIKALNAASKTTEDRRTQCNCVKEGAAKIPGLNYERVNELPDICGSACPYKLSPTLNCSSVN